MSRFIRCLALFGGLATLSLLTATSAQAIHPRPKSASPVRMSLVPAYNQCAAPNRTHGSPLAFASCNPPAQASAQATVGTPDAFGGAANATGSLRFKYLFIAPGAVDEIDVPIEMALNDVRCVPTGARCGTANASGPADYSGELRFSLMLRVTDHWNATTPDGRGPDPATVQDFAIEHSFACVQTGSTSIGSTCDLHLSLNTFMPDAARDGKRANWELVGAQIYDGGADGDGDTTADNTVFLRPGVFIP